VNINPLGEGTIGMYTNTGAVEFSTPVQYKEAELSAKINGNKREAWD